MNPLQYLLNWIQEHWMVLALGSSFYWGLHSSYLFTWRSHLKENHLLFWGLEDRKFFRRLRFSLFFIYMFVFHFVGSLVGWMCLYVLLARIQVVNGLYDQLTSKWFDLGLLTFSVLGVTNHLPQTLWGIVMSLSKLSEAAINKFPPVDKMS